MNRLAIADNAIPSSIVIPAPYHPTTGCFHPVVGNGNLDKKMKISIQIFSGE